MTSTTAPAEALGPPAPVEAAPETPIVESPAPAPARTHVVTRPFHGAGCQRVVGEVVDASAWRSAERLCETRYLRPLLAGDPEPVTDGDRIFIDDDSLLAYIEAMPATETEED